MRPSNTGQQERGHPMRAASLIVCVGIMFSEAVFAAAEITDAGL